MAIGSVSMYSTDLSTIDLTTFEETILTIDLIPSRRMLVDGIAGLVPRLGYMGVSNLEDLRRLLRDKARYPDLAADLEVSEQYLTVLNREVNAYVSKPVPLARLDVFTDRELKSLRAAGVTSSKTLYDRCCLTSERTELADELGLDLIRLELALDLSNLVRINGVGPSFARFIRDLGIRGPREFNAIDPTDVLERYRKSIAAEATPGPDLRIEDLEYCRRFSRHLSDDVER